MSVRGVPAVLVGAAVIAAVAGTGRHREHAWIAQPRDEATIAEAAAAVCRGRPSSAAALSSGPRAVIQVLTRVDDGGAPWRAVTEWPGLRPPISPAELGVVVCRNRQRTSVRNCEQRGSWTINEYRVRDELELRDARTAEIIARETFETGEFSEGCDGRGLDVPVEELETAFIIHHLVPGANARTSSALEPEEVHAFALQLTVLLREGDGLFRDIIAKGLMAELCRKRAPDVVRRLAGSRIFEDRSVLDRLRLLHCGDALLEGLALVRYSFEHARWMDI